MLSSRTQNTGNVIFKILSSMRARQTSHFEVANYIQNPPLVGGSVCLIKEEFKNSDAGHLSIKSLWASNLKMRTIGMRI